MHQLDRHQMPRPTGEHRRRVADSRMRRPGGATSTICGGYSYQTRTLAKTHAKRMPPVDGQHARAFRCRAGCSGWHVDYLPAMVTHGVVTADEWYGHDGGQPMRDVLLHLVNAVHTTTGGTLTFERRRVESLDSDPYDLWGAMIDLHGHTYIARDYDTPDQATAAALTELADAHTGTEARAA